MQAKLPDINAAFVRHRSNFLQCIEVKEFSGSVGALYAINALLASAGDEYKIEIDTDLYQSKVLESYSIFCGFCNNEINRNSAQIRKKLLSYTEFVVSNHQFTFVWNCPKCKKDNIVSKTKMVKNILAKPYFLKVVPEPPRKKAGIENMRDYKIRMIKWCWDFFNELEHSLGLYRKEYLKDNPEEYENSPGEKEEEY